MDVIAEWALHRSVSHSLETRQTVVQNEFEEWMLWSSHEKILDDDTRLIEDSNSGKHN